MFMDQNDLIENNCIPQLLEVQVQSVVKYKEGFSGSQK